jgi:hypothetical protein
MSMRCLDAAFASSAVKHAAPCESRWKKGKGVATSLPPGSTCDHQRDCH